MTFYELLKGIIIKLGLAVRTDAQTLSDEQKAQARENIGAMSADVEIPSITGLATETYVDEQIAAIPTPDVSGQIETHNASDTAHADIRESIAANASAIELLTNGASAEEVDSVNDLIQYVKDHGGEVTGIKADIKTNAINIGDIFLALGEDEPKTEAKTVSGAINELYDEVNTKADKTAFIIIDQADNKAKTIDGEIITANEILATVLDGTNVIASCAGALLTLIIVSNDVCVFTGTLIEDNDHFTMQIDIDSEGTATIQIQDISDKVSYNEQTLTEEQKSQARENIGAGVPQVQADHAQNDSTAPDYIKNRLAWTDDENEILIPKQSFTFENGLFQTTLPEGAVVCEPGKRYIVTWEDEPYSILCEELAGNIIGGNLSLAAASLENTQEPFFFGYNPNSNIMVIFTNMPDGIYEIELKTDPIHKIDPQYYEQPYYSEYFEPIDFTETTHYIFSSELIGSRVTTYYSNKAELKSNPVKPEAEGVIYSDSNLLQIAYSTNGMTNIPVLFAAGALISCQMGEFDEKYNYIGLVYCYEKTKILLNNKEYDKGWYYFRATSNGEIFLVDSWDPKKDPIYLYLKDECIDSLYISQIVTQSFVTNYIITEDNLITFGGDSSDFIIGNFNSFFLSNLSYNKTNSNSYMGFIAFSDFIVYDNYAVYSTHELKNSFLGGQNEIVLIEPIKKLKKIESQYIPYIQPDWNQNDKTKSDYIKNRFGGWSEYERNDILRVLESDFVIDDYSNGTANLSIDLKLEENKTYEVQYAMDSYVLLPCKRYDNTLYLGNYSFYNSDIHLGSEYPFVVISNDTYSCWIYNQYAGDGSDFTVTLIDEIVHQIPEKYIPDTIARVKDIPIITVEDIDEICGQTIYYSSEVDL